MADAGNINAARCDVSGDQNADLASAETLQCSSTLSLRFVTMDGGGFDAGACQMADNAVGTVLGARED